MTEVAGAKRRVEFFDVAKAIAILAVIAGHTAIRFLGAGRGASLTFATCFTFHLPLFFLVSGYFLHVDRPFAWKREAKTLLLPYAFTAAAVVVGVCLSNLALHDWGSTRQLFYDWGSAALYGAGDIPAHPLWPQSVRIGAIWFLPALFWARLLVVLAHKTPAPAVVVLAAFGVGYVSSQYLFLPLDVQSGLCAALYVYLGTLARKYDVFGKGVLPLWVWPCLAAVWVWAILGYEGFGMAMCAYGDTPLRFVRNVAGGLAGTMCILGACMAIERVLSWSSPWKLLCLLGRVTLPIMCVHLFEDDVVRWGWVVDFTARAFGHMSFAWLIVLAVRIILDVAIARFLTRLPLISTCVGAPRAKALPAADAPADDEAPEEDTASRPSWDGFGWEGKLLLVLVMACVGLVSAQALLMTADIDIANGTVEDLMELTGLFTGDITSVVIPLVVGVVLCALVVLMTWLLRKANPDIVFVVCLGMALLLQLLWIKAIDTSDYMYIDSKSVDVLARDYLNGTFAEYLEPKLSLAPYLEFYPFQACSIWCLVATYSLFGMGNQMAFFALNAVANCFTVTALYLMVRHAYPHKRTLLVCYSVLMLSFVPLWMSCIFLYPNYIGLAFSAWGLLASVKALDADDAGDRLAGIIWSFFLMAIGCFCKSTNMLFVLGVAVLWTVYALRAHRLGTLLPMAICLVLAMQAAGLGVRALENISGISFGKGMPKTTWVAMGTNNNEVQVTAEVFRDLSPEEAFPAFADRDGFRFVGTSEVKDDPQRQKMTIAYKAVPGWWREDMYDEFFATNNNYDLQNKRQIERILGFAKAYAANPQSALDFFGTKLATEWTNPDFMSLYYSALGDNKMGGLENNLIYQGYPLADALRVALDGLQNLVYVASFAMLAALLFSRKRLGSVPAGLCICFLMGFLCFVLWEAKSVYVVSYYLLLLPLAAMGLGSVMGFIDNLRGSSVPADANPAE